MSVVPGSQGAQAESLVDVLIDLRIDFLRRFMREHGLPSAGTKEDLRDRVVGAIASGDASTNDLIDFLDEVEPWNKQHVSLYVGEDSIRQPWRRRERVGKALASVSKEGLLDRRARLILPYPLELSSVSYSIDGRLEIVAIEGRQTTTSLTVPTRRV